MKYKFIVWFLFFSFLAIDTIAQKDSIREIRVETSTSYKPKLATAHKVPTRPIIEEPKTLLPEFTYRIPQFRYRVTPVYQPAKPIKIKGESREDLNGNYFRFGFGNFVTPLAEVHLHNGRHKNYNYGVHARHLSSNNGKPSNADFNDNLIGVYGNKKSSKGQLFGSLDFERRGFTYYGYDRDSFEFKKKDIKSAYNTIAGQTYWDNYSDRKKLGLRFGFDFTYKGNGTTDETSVVGSNYTKVRMGKGNLLFNNSYEFLRINNDSGAYARNFIQIEPRYSFKQKKYFFELGLQIFDQIDSGGNTFKVFPQAHFHHFIVPKKMQFYADLGGGVLRNSFDELSDRNLFLKEQYQTQTGYEVLSLKAGLKGLVVKKLDYHIGVTFTSRSNQAFYVSDTSATHPFQVVYGGLNTTTLHTMLDFNHNEKWFIQLGGNFYTYNSKDERNPWQLPSFDARMSISTVVAKKLKLSAKAFAIGERIQRDPENPLNDITLETILDLNLHAEYYYKPKLSFFLNANNLLNQQYQYWYFYPQYGINVLAGVTFSI